MDQTSTQKLQHLAMLSEDMGINLYLVGGCLRDHILGRSCADYDLISAEDPTPLARQIARSCGGHWFWLDETRRYSRVVIPCQPPTKNPLQLDFAPFRAPTLEQDLADRDFTINAMACQLTPAVDFTTLFDPLHGQRDLEQQVLRQCGSMSMVDDPLRILKGLRHCAQLQMTIDGDTWQKFIEHASALKGVAGERVRYELALIFSVENPNPTLELLHQSTVAKALGIPERVLNDEKPSVKMVKSIDSILRHDELKVLFKQNYQEEFSLATATKLSFYFSMLPDIVNVLPQLLKRLRLSRRLSKYVEFYCRFQLFDQHDYANLNCQKRGKLLWLEKHRAPLPEALLAVASIVGANSSHHRQALELYSVCTTYLHNGQVVPLLTGRQLKQYRPDLSGSGIGHFLKALKQAEITGTVSSHEQAINYLINWRESD